MTRATQTGAAVRIIEDPELLRESRRGRRRAAFPDLTSEGAGDEPSEQGQPWTIHVRRPPHARRSRARDAAAAGQGGGRAQGRRGAAGLGDDSARAGSTRAPPQGRGPWTGQGRRRARRDRRDPAAAGAAKAASRAVARTIGAPSRKTAGAAQRPATDGAKTTADTSAKAKAKRPATAAKRRVSSGR